MADFGFNIIVGPLTTEFNASLIVMLLGGQLIPTIQCLFGPIYSLIGSYMGHRKALVTSLVVTSISLGYSGFVTDTLLFIAFYCVVPGLCYGQINQSAMSILITYFDKKLAIVNGLYKGMWVLGALIHTMPLNYLALNYNLKQAHLNVHDEPFCNQYSSDAPLLPSNQRHRI